MNLLRNYISRIILSEGMIKPSSIDSYFGLWTDWTPGSKVTGKKFVLYDTRKAKKNIEYFYPGRLEAMAGVWRWVYISDMTPGRYEQMDQAVVATMKCRDYNTLSKKCGGAWEVVAAAATGGHGPTLYDLVMSLSPGGLFSDRTSVSDEAHAVWEFYANNRPEIEKKIMDAVSRFTPEDETDDCYTYDQYNEAMIQPTRARAIEFLEKYATNIGVALDVFYDEVERDEHGRPLMTTYGENLFKAFRDWFRQEISPDTAEMERKWLEWKKTHPVIDYVTWQITDPDYLDIIYNTDYAVSSAQKMIANHKKMLEDLRNLGIDYGSEESVNKGFSLMTGEFFDEHYNG